MNLYVFFCFTIKDVGGAQLYIRKKTEYLQKKGWSVKCVYALDGESLIDDLCSIDSMRVQEMHFRTNYYSKLRRKNIVSKLIDFLGSGYEAVIVESHSLSLTSWAELVSKKINARHLVYNINEIVRCPKEYFDYYSFKCNRRELKGIKPESIPMFFSGYSHNMNVMDTCLSAYGARECIFDVKYDVPDFGGNYTIGVVGRLDKGFVKDTFEEIGKFLNQYKDISFNVVYVGGEMSINHEIQKQLKKYYQKNHNNVQVYFTGYLFPIPKCLIESFNVCVSGAGAANEVSRYLIPTITIDPLTLIPNGVLWVDTKATIFNDGSNVNNDSLSYYLEQVYKHPENYNPKPVVKQGDLEEHLKALQWCDSELLYHTRCFERTTISYLIKRLATFLFSTKVLLRIGRLIMPMKQV